MEWGGGEASVKRVQRQERIPRDISPLIQMREFCFLIVRNPDLKGKASANSS